MNETANRIPALFGSCVFNEETMQPVYPRPLPWTPGARVCSEGKALTLAVANDIADGMKVMGAGAGRDALYPLVPAHDRLHRRKARQLHLALPVSGTICHGVFRQGAGDAASRTPRRSRRADCARHSRHAATPRGTPPPTPSSRTVRLYIPTVFCSYSGEALDKKTPLLRSIERGQPAGGADSSPVRRHKDAEGHRHSVGPEQEYFLIDKELYLKREDLRMCGRTLFGAKPPKGQELDDHYYGSIRPRVDRLHAGPGRGALEARHLLQDQAQ